MNVPTITQDNVRLLLPGKITRLVTMIQKSEGLSATEALIQFYNSSVYAMLEREETKVWYMSSKQLFDMYQAGKVESGKWKVEN